MKTEEILNLIMMLKDKTGEVKMIMDDFQQFTEHLSEAAKIGKNIIEKVEKIKK